MELDQTKEEIKTAFEKLVNEYFNATPNFSYDNEDAKHIPLQPPDLEYEKQVVDIFFHDGCGCKRNCQKLFTKSEILDARIQFKSLSKNERNAAVLALLNTFLHHSELAISARTQSTRQRQKFDYRINADRFVCRNAFLVYYGESQQRLTRLKMSIIDGGIQPPMHGNKGAIPVNTYPKADRELVKSFILNFADNHGMPDPGRDVRRGKGRLRILLPSVMNYQHVHRAYTDSIEMLQKDPVGYRTFLRIWQDGLSYITFNNPKTDLCFTCEKFKKQLNQTAAILDEKKEEIQAKIYKEAVNHLRHVKQERLYYKACTKVAQTHYKNLSDGEKVNLPVKANSRNIMAHYSWDFAQQLHYPFEDQQVGPIYFKIPRRAQLFGVCCEGIPRQVNYLIDEADFTEKNANTVISLLDHYFANYGLGETSAYLSSDNCVGQNKNNALVQYLMYRVLMSLHSEIELSFLVVGHTKFSPDGYFGLIKHRYRRSKVYTYKQLAKLIEDSSENGHNICQRFESGGKSQIIYRNWTSWLSQYFSTVPKITSYHHFRIDQKKPGIVTVKEKNNSKEIEISILKTKFPFDRNNLPIKLPEKLTPQKLSAERQWYLYNQIRMHIPDENDKDSTCPKPKMAKP